MDRMRRDAKITFLFFSLFSSFVKGLSFWLLKPQKDIGVNNFKKNKKKIQWGQAGRTTVHYA